VSFLNRFRVQKISGKFSALALLFLALSLIFYRLGNIDEREISWDILGYYLYLPAGCIYEDPALQNPAWLEEINQKKNLSGTLYQISTNDKGEPIYFFLMGMAWLYLPFFLIAHFLASLLGYPVDGFSTPYQLMLVFGGFIYTLIGMVFFRKILLRFLPDRIAGMVLLVIYLGTNAVHHLSLKNLETVNMLFTLVCLLTWLTIRWYEQPRIRFMTGIAICAALMVLVKPSEVFIILIPLLWNFDGWKNRIRLFQHYKIHLGIAVIIGMMLLMPQISYWYFRTGHFIYDSYKNPGIGLDFLNPHIPQILFSFRKGWLVYTPVMALALLGWIVVWKHNRKLFIPAFAYFLVTFYVVSCWTEWWYGASFSTRPLIVAYPFLGLSLGYLLKRIQEKRPLVRLIAAAVMILLMLLNLFQYFQFRKNILDPYRTTPAYYKAVFLKTSVPPGAEKLLLINRDFSGKDKFSNPWDYRASEWAFLDFNNDTASNIIHDPDGRVYYRIRENEEFGLPQTSQYKNLSHENHVWFRIEFDARFPAGLGDPPPCLVSTMERREGAYGYRAFEIRPDGISANWKHFTVEYLSPEIRNTKDEFKCYFWNRSKVLLDIDNFRITVFEP
jgi:hypothetical protein